MPSFKIWRRSCAQRRPGEETTRWVFMWISVYVCLCLCVCPFVCMSVSCKPCWKWKSRTYLVHYPHAQTLQNCSCSSWAEHITAHFLLMCVCENWRFNSVKLHFWQKLSYEERMARRLLGPDNVTYMFDQDNLSDSQPDQVRHQAFILSADMIIQIKTLQSGHF